MPADRIHPRTSAWAGVLAALLLASPLAELSPKEIRDVLAYLSTVDD